MCICYVCGKINHSGAIYMYIIHGSLQVLCMWYNITMQLHHKVNLLGQILIGKFILLLLILIILGKCTMIYDLTPIFQVLERGQVQQTFGLNWIIVVEARCGMKASEASIQI